MEVAPVQKQSKAPTFHHTKKNSFLKWIVLLASLLTEGQIPTILELVQFCAKGGSANG